MTITGGCHCGAICYQAREPIHHRTHCHCSICRAFGGTLMSWITVDSDSFAYGCGSPALYQSSANGRREFCGHCGTQLTFAHRSQPKHVDIAIGSLDHPEEFAPDNQIWMDDALPFLAEMHNLPMSPQAGRASVNKTPTMLNEKAK